VAPHHQPLGAIGAGPVLAAAAGADLADLEFCQFHPTALALPGALSTAC
jgi:L-aspartate oxidase